MVNVKAVVNEDGGGADLRASAATLWPEPVIKTARHCRQFPQHHSDSSLHSLHVGVRHRTESATLALISTQIVLLEPNMHVAENYGPVLKLKDGVFYLNPRCFCYSCSLPSLQYLFLWQREQKSNKATF